MNGMGFYDNHLPNLTGAPSALFWPRFPGHAECLSNNCHFGTVFYCALINLAGAGAGAIGIM